MLQFKPYIQVSLNEEKKEVLINRPLKDGNMASVFDLTGVGLEVLKGIGHHSYADLVNKVLSKYPESNSEIEEIIQFLLSENYVESVDTSLDESRGYSKFNRIIPLWAELEDEHHSRYDIQNKIMTSKVGIVGCGTLGAGVIGQLSSMGVENFILIDPDRVEDTNLTRQPLFSLQDIGKKKVNVLKEFILNRNEKANVTVFDSYIYKIEDLGVFKDVDMIISGGDSGDIDKLVNQYARKNNKKASFIGSYSGHNGRIFPIYSPGKSHDLECIHNYLDSKMRFKGVHVSNSSYTYSTVPYISEFLVSIAVGEMIKSLIDLMEPYTLNKLLSINISEYTIDTIEIPNEFEGCTCLLPSKKIYNH